MAAGPLESTAESVVRATARLSGEGTWRGFVLDLDVLEGWHVNANAASLPFLVPTAVEARSGALRSVKEVLAPLPMRQRNVPSFWKTAFKYG